MTRSAALPARERGFDSLGPGFSRQLKRRPRGQPLGNSLGLGRTRRRSEGCARRAGKKLTAGSGESFASGVFAENWRRSGAEPKAGENSVQHNPGQLARRRTVSGRKGSPGRLATSGPPVASVVRSSSKSHIPKTLARARKSGGCDEQQRNRDEESVPVDRMTETRRLKV
jgi:hypothetical protein